MPEQQNPAPSRLIALIEEASGEAAKLGSSGQAVAAALAQALSACRAASGTGAAPTEGIRVENLTTDNDK